MNWPTSGMLYPKLCFVYISVPADAPKDGTTGVGKTQNMLT